MVLVTLYRLTEIGPPSVNAMLRKVNTNPEPIKESSHSIREATPFYLILIFILDRYLFCLPSP